MMNRYIELRERQQKEFNALPLGFAFGDKQFNEMMKKWGLDPDKDTDKIYHVMAGCYVRKGADHRLLHDTWNRFEAEREREIREDTTGDGFVFDMFLTELEDHEFGYTRNPEDALDAIGLTWDEVQEDSRLKHGFEKAICEIINQDEEEE